MSVSTSEKEARPASPAFALLVAIRPLEWTKNAFVFAPVIFSGNLTSPPAVISAATAFIALCMAASATYLLNDVRDREADRAHPTKCHRPIAAGVIAPRHAILMASVLGLTGIALAFTVNRFTGFGVFGYLALTTLYSMALKGVVILDVVTLACGFVLRVIVGSVAIGVQFSAWLVLCTFMLALFLGFGKRRNELTLLEGKAIDHRPILGEYSPQFLDLMMSVVTTAAVMSYVMYTMDPDTMAHFGSAHLVYTSVFVLYGIFRYLYLIHKRSFGGNPAQALYRDTSLLLAVFCWIASILLMRYL